MEQVVREIRLETLDVRVENEDKWSVVLQATVAGADNIAIIGREVVFKLDGGRVAGTATDDFGEARTEPLLVSSHKKQVQFTAQVVGSVKRGIIFVNSPTYEVELRKTKERETWKAIPLDLNVEKKLVAVYGDGKQVWEVIVIIFRKNRVVAGQEILFVKGRNIRSLITDRQGRIRTEIELYPEEVCQIRVQDLDLTEEVRYLELPAVRLELIKDDSKMVGESEQIKDVVIRAKQGDHVVINLGIRLSRKQELLGRTGTDGIWKYRLRVRSNERISVVPEGGGLGVDICYVCLSKPTLEVVDKRLEIDSNGNQIWDTTVVVKQGGKLMLDQEVFFDKGGRKEIVETDSRGVARKKVCLARQERVEIGVVGFNAVAVGQYQPGKMQAAVAVLRNDSDGFECDILLILKSGSGEFVLANREIEVGSICETRGAMGRAMRGSKQQFVSLESGCTDNKGVFSLFLSSSDVRGVSVFEIKTEGGYCGYFSTSRPEQVISLHLGREI